MQSIQNPNGIRAQTKRPAPNPNKGHRARAPHGRRERTPRDRPRANVGFSNSTCVDAPARPRAYDFVMKPRAREIFVVFLSFVGLGLVYARLGRTGWVSR